MHTYPVNLGGESLTSCQSIPVWEGGWSKSCLEHNSQACLDRFLKLLSNVKLRLWNIILRHIQQSISFLTLLMRSLPPGIRTAGGSKCFLAIAVTICMLTLYFLVPPATRPVGMLGTFQAYGRDSRQKLVGWAVLDGKVFEIYGHSYLIFNLFFFFWNGDKVDLHTARTSTNVPQQSRGWILSTWTRLRKALLWGNKNGDLEAEKLRLRRISSLLSMGVCITIHNAVNRQCPRVACTQRRWTGGGGCLVFWGDVQRQ